MEEPRQSRICSAWRFGRCLVQKTTPQRESGAPAAERKTCRGSGYALLYFRTGALGDALSKKPPHSEKAAHRPQKEKPAAALDMLCFISRRTLWPQAHPAAPLWRPVRRCEAVRSRQAAKRTPWQILPRTDGCGASLGCTLQPGPACFLRSKDFSAAVLPGLAARFKALAARSARKLCPRHRILYSARRFLPDATGTPPVRRLLPGVRAEAQHRCLLKRPAGEMQAGFESAQRPLRHTAFGGKNRRMAGRLLFFPQAYRKKSPRTAFWSVRGLCSSVLFACDAAYGFCLRLRALLLARWGASRRPAALPWLRAALTYGFCLRLRALLLARRGANRRPAALPWLRAALTYGFCLRLRALLLAHRGANRRPAALPWLRAALTYGFCLRLRALLLARRGQTGGRRLCLGCVPRAHLWAPPLFTPCARLLALLSLTGAASCPGKDQFWARRTPT